MSSNINARRMNIDNINPCVKAAKYAVRGELSLRAEKLSLLLKSENHGLPFKDVVSAHIGNPHGLGQKPITFFRQVLSLLENPALLESEDILQNHLGYKPDVIKRAKFLLREVRSLGSYSPTRGIPAIQNSVARFLEGKLPEMSQSLFANMMIQNVMAFPHALNTSISLQVLRLESGPSYRSYAQALRPAFSSLFHNTRSTLPLSVYLTLLAYHTTLMNLRNGELTSTILKMRINLHKRGVSR